MSFSLLPTWMAGEITQLKPSFLLEQGVRLVMLDFDNTIIPYTTNEPPPEVLAWMEDMYGAGLRLCVVSNSHNSRVPDFCEKYGLDCVTHAKKPFSRGIKECLARYDIPPRESVLIGDQIYTDTLGGNCAGVRTVLVRSINNHTFWLKLRHVAEMPFILFAKNRRIKE